MEAWIAASARTQEPRTLRPLAAVGDERLARLVAGAHEQAFATLYERYHQTLYRYCRSIVRNDADAQDVLQSTFARAFTALRRGQRDAPVRPWLFRIAHNEAVSLLRRRRPEEELSRASGCAMASAEELAGERARFALLLADLQELPERQRGALVMRELSGLSHEEISIALRTTVGAAKQTLFEARRSLLEFAEGREMACHEVRRAISDADGRVLRARRMRAHLRECSGCAAFAAAIPARSSDLRALVPVLPTASAAGVLSTVVGSGSGHGGASGLAAGAAGKTAGLALASKAVAGAVIVATATVGVTTIIKPGAHAPGHAASAHPTPARHTGGAGGAGGAGGSHGANAGTTVLVHRPGTRGAVLKSVDSHARARGLARGSTPGATRGAVANGPSVTSSGGTSAHGQASAPANGADSDDVTGSAVGRGKSLGTQKPKGTPASANGRGRPASPGSRRATPDSGKPPKAGSGKPATADSGKPTAPPAAPSTTPTTSPTDAPSTSPTDAPSTAPGHGPGHTPAESALNSP